MRVDMQKRRTAGIHAIAERLLDAGLIVIKTMAINHLDDQMGSGKNTAPSRRMK